MLFFYTVPACCRPVLNLTFQCMLQAFTYKYSFLSNEIISCYVCPHKYVRTVSCSLFTSINTNHLWMQCGHLSHTRTRTHIRTHAHTHTRTHIRTHTHTHARAHTHTHTHTCAPHAHHTRTHTHTHAHHTHTTRTPSSHLHTHLVVTYTHTPNRHLHTHT